ncbi:putative serine/threonine-protein kinase [Iris pallida]|uniref:Serine/threonine-protein kinase n=1 Tax=Iris pallida TaxID=29817 RepID=A0AAX6EQR3_IRIPA|nr:putative serine/threonine-protein kinase [Iris pallida]
MHVNRRRYRIILQAKNWMLLRDEKARRQRRNDAKGKAQGRRKARVHDHLSKAVPAPEENAELQVNLNRWMMARMNVTTQSEKFPPPHQDGAVGIITASFVVYDTSLVRLSLKRR